MSMKRIPYSFKDFLELAPVITVWSNTDKSVVSDVTETWKDSIKGTWKSCKGNLREILREIFCNYLFGPAVDQSELNKLVFSTPIEKMPLYIASNVSWENLIALWRLKISK